MTSPAGSPLITQTIGQGTALIPQMVVSPQVITETIGQGTALNPQVTYQQTIGQNTALIPKIVGSPAPYASVGSSIGITRGLDSSVTVIDTQPPFASTSSVRHEHEKIDHHEEHHHYTSTEVREIVEEVPFYQDVVVEQFIPIEREVLQVVQKREQREKVRVHEVPVPVVQTEERPYEVPVDAIETREVITVTGIQVPSVEDGGYHESEREIVERHVVEIPQDVETYVQINQEQGYRGVFVEKPHIINRTVKRKRPIIREETAYIPQITEKVVQQEVIVPEFFEKLQLKEVEVPVQHIIHAPQPVIVPKVAEKHREVVVEVPHITRNTRHVERVKPKIEIEKVVVPVYKEVAGPTVKRHMRLEPRHERAMPVESREYIEGPDLSPRREKTVVVRPLKELLVNERREVIVDTTSVVTDTREVIEVIGSDRINFAPQVLHIGAGVDVSREVIRADGYTTTTIGGDVVVRDVVQENRIPLVTREEVVVRESPVVERITTIM